MWWCEQNEDARSKDLQIFGGAPIFSIKHQTSADLLMNFRLCPQRLLNKKLIYSYLYFLTIIEHKRRAAQSCANEDPKGYSNGIIDENVLWNQVKSNDHMMCQKKTTLAWCVKKRPLFLDVSMPSQWRACFCIECEFVSENPDVHRRIMCLMHDLEVGVAKAATRGHQLPPATTSALKWPHHDFGLAMTFL